MKAVVVNDCANVMLDMIPYLRNAFQVQMITRTRSIISKTIGLFSNVLLCRGDLFHVSYALQDAYLVQKMKHLDVLHVHGSDVRSTIQDKKFGWMVRGNLREAKKVIYSTPDLKEILQSIRSDAEYFPTPVNIHKFFKREFYHKPKHAKAIYFSKPYERINMHILYLLKMYNIPLTIQTERIDYDQMDNLLNQFNIFVDQTSIPALSKTCLEAMSCGLSTLDHRDKWNLADKVAFLTDRETREEIGLKNIEYIKKHHNAELRANRLIEIWKEVLK